MQWRSLGQFWQRVLELVFRAGEILSGARASYGDSGVPVCGWGLVHRILQLLGDATGRVAVLHNWHMVLP